MCTLQSKHLTVNTLYIYTVKNTSGTHYVHVVLMLKLGNFNMKYHIF